MVARLNLPPGPKSGILGLDFVNQMKADSLATALNLKSEFGDFVHIKSGPVHWFMFNHPDQVKDVLLTRSKLFGKTDIFKRVLSSVDGNGLVVSEGAFWLRQRRSINPAFSHSRVAGYARAIKEETCRYVERWQPGMILNLADEMTELTLIIAAKLFFNVDVSRNAKRLSDAVNVLSKSMLSEFYDFIPIPEWMPLPSKRAKQKALSIVDKLIFDSIEAHEKSPKQIDDVLSMLIEARDPEDQSFAMSDKQIRDEAITLFNAGHDSTAAALSWAWYLLLTEPEIYDQFSSFARSSYSIEKEDSFSLSMQIAKETLRLYPPAWTLPRQSLEDTKIGDYDIPRGSLINFFPYVMHRDERFFDEPECFRPVRFSRENEQKLIPFAYIPFGAGPRACIGKEMALSEISIILATVLRYFDFELIPGQQIHPVTLISLEQSSGVKVIVKGRREINANHGE